MGANDECLSDCYTADLDEAARQYKRSQTLKKVLATFVVLLLIGGVTIVKLSIDDDQPPQKKAVITEQQNQ